MTDNNRNLFITIILSVVILTVWQVFFMNPRIEAQREAAQIEQERIAAQSSPSTDKPGQPAGTVPGTPQASVPGTAGAAAAANREAAVAASQRIRIDTPKLIGSINLAGARIDDIELRDYHTQVDKNSPNIQLLNPATMANGQYAEIGYVAPADAGQMPGPETVWTAPANAVLTPSTPVTLTFVNDKGVSFTRTVSVDDEYMFKVVDRIENGSDQPVSIQNYGRVTRFDKPAEASIYVLHEGLVGVTGTEGLQEIDYSEIEDAKRISPSKSTDGWLGITDKYWAVALVPGAEPFQPNFSYFDDGRPRYQVDYLEDPIQIGAGDETDVETLVFAGAKEVDVISQYHEEYQIRLFDRMIDWGWFPYLTKPMFWLIDNLYKLLGNFGLAILGTTVIVKAVFFPLANKSYVSMANMKKMQPKMLEIREKYADDKMKQQQAMMALYKEEKINPLAGCWPILIQIPVFFALYKVIYITIEMRHAPFFGWIQDLSAPDPTSIFNLFGLLPFAVPAFLLIGVWPIIMGITMFLQMRMNPTPPDPTQAMIFNWMPIIFTFMLATFPAGLVIYWAWNNFLSIVQQGVIMKRQGAKIELWDNLIGLFKKKPTPAE